MHWKTISHQTLNIIQKQVPVKNNFRFKSMSRISKCQKMKDNLIKFKQKQKESCTNVQGKSTKRSSNLFDTSLPTVYNASGSFTPLEKELQPWTPKQTPPQTPPIESKEKDSIGDSLNGKGNNNDDGNGGASNSDSEEEIPPNPNEDVTFDQLVKNNKNSKIGSNQNGENKLAGKNGNNANDDANSQNLAYKNNGNEMGNLNDANQSGNNNSGSGSPFISNNLGQMGRKGNNTNNNLNPDIDNKLDNNKNSLNDQTTNGNNSNQNGDNALANANSEEENSNSSESKKNSTQKQNQSLSNHGLSNDMKNIGHESSSHHQSSQNSIHSQNSLYHSSFSHQFLSHFSYLSSFLHHFGISMTTINRDVSMFDRIVQADFVNLPTNNAMIFASAKLKMDVCKPFMLPDSGLVSLMHVSCAWFNTKALRWLVEEKACDITLPLIKDDGGEASCMDLIKGKHFFLGIPDDFDAENYEDDDSGEELVNPSEGLYGVDFFHYQQRGLKQKVLDIINLRKETQKFVYSKVGDISNDGFKEEIEIPPPLWWL